MSFTVQHKRSGDINRRPKPTELVNGQVGINYNNASPGMFFRTDTGSIVKVGPAHVGSSAPVQTNWGERSIGEMWLDTSTSPTSVLKFWTAAGWDTVTSFVQTTSVFVPPTSAAGLPSGAVWNNNGALQLVP